MIWLLHDLYFDYDCCCASLWLFPSEGTEACTTHCNQQMEHIQYWTWPWLSLKSHCFNALNYNSCLNLSPPTTDTSIETQVLLSDYSLKRNASLFTFSDVNDRTNANQVSPFWSHLWFIWVTWLPLTTTLPLDE